MTLSVASVASVASPSADSTCFPSVLWLRSQLTGYQHIHQMHRDIVHAYPPGVEQLGTSPVCEVQGMYVPRRLITVQGHPEFNEEIMREILGIRREQSIFDQATYEDGIRRVAQGHDGAVVAGAFLRFLLEGRSEGRHRCSGEGGFQV